MSGIGPSLGLSGVLALRAEILQRSEALSASRPSVASKVAGDTGETGFSGAMAQALKAVNALQTQSSADGTAWERGETQDIAAVMLSRQKASIAFEATLQARNRLLSAYRDIMNMPV